MNPTLEKAIEEYYSTDSEKSIETLKSLVDKSPEDTVLQAFLADAYTKHGKDVEAKALLEVLKEKDLSADALIFVVRAYDALGFQTDAKELLMKHFSSSAAAEPAVVETPKESVETPKESVETPKESEEAPKESEEAPKESVETPKEPEVQAGGKKTRKVTKGKKNATKRKQRST